MTLDQLVMEWQKDCQIEDDLSAAAIRTPMLHAKYIEELITAKLRLTKLVHEIAEVKTIKAKYFRGEMTKAELDDRGWTQWAYRSLKGDIEGLIESDADYQKLVARESYIKSTIYFLESVLGEIKNRNWSIRASLDFQKFRAGA